MAKYLKRSQYFDIVKLLNLEVYRFYIVPIISWQPLKHEYYLYSR